MKEMPPKYSLNQKGAVVTVTFAAVWALLSMIIAIDMGLQSTFALEIFAVMTLIAWILVPLYVKRMKAAYVLGVILLVLGLGGLFASPGDPPWYTFTVPISIVKELSFVVDSLVGIYFSIKSLGETWRNACMHSNSEYIQFQKMDKRTHFTCIYHKRQFG